MNLDIRMPMGIMFAIFGILLVGWGLASANDPMYQRSLGININLLWGAVQLVFGLVMIYFARKSMKKPQ
jgi:hypothetical protein